MMKIALSELNQKRWTRFKKRKLAVLSLWVLVFFTFLSFTAEFWANSKPVVLSYKNTLYFPVIKNYHPKLFGIENAFVVDYRNLTLSKDDWALWPPIQWDPFESNEKIESYPGEPTKTNLMGTDDRGRDLLTRLLYGHRYGMIYSCFVWLITVVIGTILGAIMGFFGGRVDFLGQRIVEILSTVPQFFLLIIIISIFKPSIPLLIFISSLFGWIGISYYVRAEFLKNRKKEFVEAAVALGASKFRQIFIHILPNSLSPIITFAPFVISSNIVGLASLDYLGFGLTPPTPSWGELLGQAQKNFTIGWWLAVYPSVALFLVLTLLSLIGDGVRDAMDPYLNER
ncbi:MAG: ABC transporter permease subunit [Bacteriovoracaceae bacterium]